MSIRDCWRSYQARRAAQRRSKGIDRQIRRWWFIERVYELKILLIVDSVADKDSFIKFMIDEQSSSQRRHYFRKHVCFIIFAAIERIVIVMENNNLQCRSKHTMSLGKQLVKKQQYTWRFIITPEEQNDIALFWRDEGVQTCVTQQTEFQTGFEAMKYYLDNLDRVIASDYAPTEQDILQGCVVTTDGVNEFIFPGDKIAFRLIDFGEYPPRSHRIRSTIHHECFNNVIHLIKFDYCELKSERSERRILAVASRCPFCHHSEVDFFTVGDVSNEDCQSVTLFSQHSGVSTDHRYVGSCSSSSTENQIFSNFARVVYDWILNYNRFRECKCTCI